MSTGRLVVLQFALLGVEKIEPRTSTVWPVVAIVSWVPEPLSANVTWLSWRLLPALPVWIALPVLPELPEIVESTTSTAPGVPLRAALSIPPPENVAELPAIRLCETSRSPPELAIPPPTPSSAKPAGDRDAEQEQLALVEDVAAVAVVREPLVDRHPREDHFGGVGGDPEHPAREAAVDDRGARRGPDDRESAGQHQLAAGQRVRTGAEHDLVGGVGVRFRFLHRSPQAHAAQDALGLGRARRGRAVDRRSDQEGGARGTGDRQQAEREHGSDSEAAHERDPNPRLGARATRRRSGSSRTGRTRRR